jgi:hypothetical protein
MMKTVQYLRLLVAGFSASRPGFWAESDHLEFVVDKEALGKTTLFIDITVRTSLTHFLLN